MGKRTGKESPKTEAGARGCGGATFLCEKERPELWGRGGPKGDVQKESKRVKSHLLRTGN